MSCKSCFTDWSPPCWRRWRFFCIASGAIVGSRATAVASEPILPAPDIADENVRADQLPEDGWTKLARELLERGEFRLAMRAFYLASLSHLAARNLISIARFKSNRDYERELRRRGACISRICFRFSTTTFPFSNASGMGCTRSTANWWTSSLRTWKDQSRRMKKYFPIVILLGCAAAFAFGVVPSCLQLRFEAGDVYPPYSSLRADPLGAMAFYESLGKIPGISVRRDFSASNRLPEEPRHRLPASGRPT